MAPRAAVDKRITATTIPVGLEWIDATKLNAATSSATGGPSPVGGGNPKRQAQAVADYINAHGGVAGRKIVLVLRERDISVAVSPGGREREGQAACATFAEDNNVFVMAPRQLSQSLLECAKNTKTVLMPLGANNSLDRQDFENYADVFYNPSAATYERRARALVKSLVRQRFFEKEAKVGLLLQDLPGVKRSVKKALLPALAEAGIKPSDVIQIYYPEPVGSPWQNYVVTFQQEGVTHVLFSNGDGGALPPVLFMQAAEQQQYRPFYGIGDESNPGGIPGLAPLAQYKRVRGVGGIPIYITNLSAGTPAANLCTAIMKGAGEPAGTTGGGGLGWFYCDTLFFLKEVLDRADALTPEGFRRSAETLGTSYDSVLTWVTRLGSGRHDGGELVRDYAYSASCYCYRFVSRTYPAPSS